MYSYNCELWCDACGRRIQENLELHPGLAEAVDPPRHCATDEGKDGPRHCAAGEDCLNPVDLTGWGLGDSDPLYGAETAKIGALLNERLTDEGVAYLNEMLGEGTRTPYQKALHALWREVYGDRYVLVGDKVRVDFLSDACAVLVGATAALVGEMGGFIAGAKFEHVGDGAYYASVGPEWDDARTDEENNREHERWRDRVTNEIEAAGLEWEEI